jgi:hypothetical protein
MQDPTFVSRIRGGRNPSAATIDRVREWIAANAIPRAIIKKNKQAAGA